MGGGAAISVPRSDRFLHTAGAAPLRPFAQHFIQTVEGEKRRKKLCLRESKGEGARAGNRKRVLQCGFYSLSLYFCDDFISVHIGKDIGKVFFFSLTAAECLWADFFFRPSVRSLRIRMHKSVLFAIRFVFIIPSLRFGANGRSSFCFFFTVFGVQKPWLIKMAWSRGSKKWKRGIANALLSIDD